MDKAFLKAGLPLSSITPLERLSFVGDRAIGALSYEPAHPAMDAPDDLALELLELGAAAEAEFNGHAADVLPALLLSGSSAGSRPKSQVYASLDFECISSAPQEGFDAWLVKFTSMHLPYQ